MYEIFAKLLSENEKKAIDVSRATGISPTTFSDWKSGKSTPKQDKLQKIADYFGVTITYLMTGKEEDSVQKITSLSQSEMVYAGRNESRCWKTTHCANTLKNTRTCEKEL